MRRSWSSTKRMRCKAVLSSLCGAVSVNVSTTPMLPLQDAAVLEHVFVGKRPKCKKRIKKIAKNNITADETHFVPTLRRESAIPRRSGGE